MPNQCKKKRFTHHRWDDNQRISIKDYILTDKASTLKEAHAKAKLLTSGDIKTRIKEDGDKYLIYTYLYTKPSKLKKVEQLQSQVSESKLMGSLDDTQPITKKKTVNRKRHSESSSIKLALDKLDDSNITHGYTRDQIRSLTLRWLAEDEEKKQLNTDNDGYYSPKLVKLLLKYYFCLAEGYIPFDNDDHVSGIVRVCSMLGTRLKNHNAYFEKAVIWKSDIDQAISKLNANGHILWDKICMTTNEETILPFLPFLEDRQRIIIEDYILRQSEHLEAPMILDTLIHYINGETIHPLKEAKICV